MAHCHALTGKTGVFVACRPVVQRRGVRPATFQRRPAEGRKGREQKNRCHERGTETGHRLTFAARSLPAASTDSPDIGHVGKKAWAGLRQNRGRLFLAGEGIGQGKPQSLDRLQRSEEHTSELQSLMRLSYAVFCWKKKH